MTAKTGAKPQSIKRVRLPHVKKVSISKPARLREIAGCLSDDEAAAMKEVIEKAFERIEPHAWNTLP